MHNRIYPTHSRTFLIHLPSVLSAVQVLTSARYIASNTFPIQSTTLAPSAQIDVFGKTAFLQMFEIKNHSCSLRAQHLPRKKKKKKKIWLHQFDGFVTSMKSDKRLRPLRLYSMRTSNQYRIALKNCIRI